MTDTHSTDRRVMLRAGVAASMMVATSVAASVFKPAPVARKDSNTFDLASLIPTRMAAWEIDNSIALVMPSPELKQVIERSYDQTLARSYVQARGERIMLSIAYGGSYGKEMQTHRPEVCYPAQGFHVVRSDAKSQLETPFGQIKVTRLVATAGLRSEPITYWLILGDRQSAFGLGMKLVQFQHGLRGVVADGMLVRVSSIGKDPDREFALHDRFSADLLGAIDAPARKRVAGLPIARES
jgi:EpsI family protein